MVIWVSEEYKKRFPDIVTALEKAVHKPLQSDQLLYGLMRLSGIICDGFDASKDFLDDSFVLTMSRKVANGKRIYRPIRRKEKNSNE